jgi:hypothetical protein
MLAKRKIAYTVPPDQDILDALNQYEALDAALPESETEKAEWGRLRALLTDAKVEEYRFSLSTLTVAGQNRFNAAMRRFYAWFEVQWGRTYDDVLKTYREALQAHLKRNGDGGDGSRPVPKGTPTPEPASGPKATDEQSEAMQLWEAAQGWAAITAALSAVETRTRPILADGSEVSWREAEAPDWDSYPTFEATIPGDLATALVNAVAALNPGLFGPDLRDDEKKRKYGGVRAAASVLR